MCGIIGMAWRCCPGDAGFNDRLSEALSVIRHRGPDAQGEYRDDGVWIGHTRLSILDLSAAANQPMRSVDERFIITYNGEIYNYKELAARNGLSQLRTTSDTEVILELFAKSGVGSLRELNGMFAFAIYDRSRRRLWLVRDRFGIKPLYYEASDGGLTFASEIKGILALRPRALRCDVASLHEWMYFGNPLGGRTLYSGVRQLLPGHYLELDLESFTCHVRKYWTLEDQVRERVTLPLDVHAAIERTRMLLEGAVRRQLQSDVPLGVFLSGGVDSSAITAFATRHYSGRLATYSAGFDFEIGEGELPKARRIAAHFGTAHHEVHIRGEMAADLIEKMIHCHDGPFSDPANIPLYLMASQLSGQVKVILQGDGGDELFGGYRRYWTLTRYPLFHPLARKLKALTSILLDTDFHCRVRRHVLAFAAEDPAITVALLLTPEDRSRTPSAIFGPGMRQALERSDPFERHRHCYSGFKGQDLANRMSMMDLKITLPDLYLEKVDRSTMAASLEVRVPFLDHDLVDFVIALPGEMKVPAGNMKWLLRAALEGIVPDEVLRGPKTGLNVPLGKWLQHKLKGFFLDHLAQFARRHPEVLDVAHVEKVLVEVERGRGNHANLLWKVLNLLVWANTSGVQFADEVGT